QIRGDAGQDAADLDQPLLLPGADGWASRRHRRRPPRRFHRRDQGRLGAGRHGLTSFGLDPWLTVLLLKMAIAAAVVVGCSLLAERSGPLLAAMIATLPISTGPVYVFLVMEHDPAFVGQSAGASLISNLSNSALIFGYVLMAQRFGTALSLGVGLLCWFSFA